jgi:hypothetical protein
MISFEFSNPEMMNLDAVACQTLELMKVNSEFLMMIIAALSWLKVLF